MVLTLVLVLVKLIFELLSAKRDIFGAHSLPGELLVLLSVFIKLVGEVGRLRRVLEVVRLVGALEGSLVGIGF